MADNKSSQLDPGFDEVPLDEGFQEVPLEASSPQGPSELRSGLLGGLQGASLGYADEIEAGLKSLLPGRNYQSEIANVRKEYEEAEKTNPKSYLGGEVAGGIGTALIPGIGAIGGAKGALSGLKGLTAMGAAAGIGGSTASIPEALSGDTEEAKKLALAGGLGAAGGLAGGAIGKKLGRFFSTQGTIENKLQGTLQKASEKLSSIGDDAVASKVGNAGDKAMEVFNKHVERYSKYPEAEANKIFEQTSEPVMHYIDRIKQSGNNPVELNRVKREITDFITNHLDPRAYDKTAPDFDKQKTSKILKEIAGSVKDHIEKLGDLADKGLGKEIKETNKHLGYLINRSKIINEGPELGLGDLIKPKSAAIKMAKGLTSTEEVKQAAEKIASVGEKSGIGQILKPVAESAGRATAIETAPKGEFYKKSSELYNAPDESLIEASTVLKNNPTFGKQGEALEKAVQDKDNQKKNAIIFSLMQNPKARELLLGQ